MLVLTRRGGEGISIDGKIVVSILEIKGDRVRVGIDAPRDLKVIRSEVINTRDGKTKNA